MATHLQEGQKAPAFTGIDQDGKKTRNFSYVKPLPGSIGPSKTRCHITETMDHYDLEDHVSVTVSTSTPDVPSGGVFSVKTRYCLMWGEGGSTRLISNCAVEWTGKSWIKGTLPISLRRRDFI